jgi:cell division protein FtsL
MLHPLFRFRYYILFGFFAIWMSFFDMNNLFFRYRIANEVSVLEDNIEEHKQAIAELDQQKKYLFGNDRNLQRFAREKYLMKKDNEDVFVIVEEEKVEDNNK